MSNPNDETDALHNVEGFVLEKLSTKLDPENASTSIGELMDSIDDTMFPLLDQAIEDLIAQSFVHSEDGENYLITPDGINELEFRKKEAIPLS
ncbi:MAG: hypothetical protein P0116_08630 [Candidatus Nitrosocosmicus sp.]|nr:hypothetical protein [Candidatus Nitrosocosmicus sp.]